MLYLLICVIVYSPAQSCSLHASCMIATVPLHLISFTPNYLDNDNNKRNAPNENLARELLELFTLGEGNYDEHTVKEAARALTGYRTNELKDLSFEISPWDQDRGLKNILGSWGFHDGDDLIDLILDQPSSSEFIARKFWRHYVSEFQFYEAEIQEIALLYFTNCFFI